MVLLDNKREKNRCNISRILATIYAKEGSNMKRMRLPLFIALGVAVLGIVFGSFFDLNISQALGDPNGGFALAVSSIAPTIGFLGLSVLGGAWFVLGKNKDYPMWARVLFFIACAGCVVSSTYFSGKEFFGVNGFYQKAPSIVGYLIAGVVHIGSCVGGYFLFRNSLSKKAWIYLIFAMGVMLLALVGGTTLLKEIFHRPRYRVVSVDAYEKITFLAWWQRCGNYKDLMASYNLTSEEFKSFPSGHTCESTILMATIVFLPLLNAKLEKLQLPLFVCAGMFTLLVAFARIMAAAHYLSDVSMGAFLTLFFLIIANEIVLRSKRLQPEETQAA